MTAPDSSSSAGFSRSRRLLLGLGGASLLAGLGAYLGWPRSGRVTSPASPGTTSAPQDTAISEEVPAEVASSATPFTANAFAPYLHTEFHVSGPAGSSLCKLTQISKETRQDTAKGSWAAFSLVFETAPGFLKDGGICQVTHEGMDAMEIFLSPVGNKNQLEAVFSRRI